MIFNVTDHVQAEAKDLNGGLIKLLGKNIRIQVVFIFNEGRPPSQFPGDDDLRGFEQNEIPFLHMLAIAFKDMEIRGGVSA
jgi:hypothetical protein